MLEGMPEPRDLRLHRPGGRCVITVGGTVLFDYDAADTLMRNMAISALRRLGFPGRRVAAVLGLTDNYVATLHSAALREGSAALIRHARPGRPSKLGEPDWASAAAWRGQGLSDTEIGRRLGVAHTTVGRRLGPRPGAAGGGRAGLRACGFPAPAGASRPAGAGAGSGAGGRGGSGCGTTGQGRHGTAGRAGT